MNDATQTKTERLSSKTALLEAAFEEFSSQGYEATTVAQVAARAGVTTGAVYAHFRGKLELLAETLGLERVSGFWRAVSVASTMSWPEAAEYLSDRLSNRGDMRAMTILLDVIVVARRDPEVAAALRQPLGEFIHAMEKAAEVGAAAGLIDPPLGPSDLARVFTVIYFGLLIFDALEEPVPSKEAFVRLTDVLLQGPPLGEPQVCHPAALARVHLRSIQADRAQRQLSDAIAEADVEGHSLRQIGSAANLSHEQIRRLLRSEVNPAK